MASTLQDSKTAPAVFSISFTGLHLLPISFNTPRTLAPEDSPPRPTPETPFTSSSREGAREASHTGSAFK